MLRHSSVGNYAGNGGTKLLKALSSSSATARQWVSRLRVATTCIPNGKPRESKPSGT